MQRKALLPKLFIQSKITSIYLQVISNKKSVQRTQVMQHCSWQAAPANFACDCSFQHKWWSVGRALKYPFIKASMEAAFLIQWQTECVQLGTHPGLNLSISLRKTLTGLVRTMPWIQLGLCLTQNPAILQEQKWDLQLWEPRLQTLSHPRPYEDIYDRKPGGFSLVEKNFKGTGLDRWLTARTLI